MTDKYWIYYTCPSCYLNYQLKQDKVVFMNPSYPIEKTCDWCEDYLANIPNRPFNSIMKRKLDVMRTTPASDFPRLIKDIFAYFETKIDNLEDHK